MIRWVAAGLAAALLLIGWLYHNASEELATTKLTLAVALEANESNKAAIGRLQRSMENTDKVLAGWNEDRTTLAGVRSATRQAIREAMSDETFNTWASEPAPADAGRMLNAHIGTDGNDSVGSPGGASGGLPGNAAP